MGPEDHVDGEGTPRPLEDVMQRSDTIKDCGVAGVPGYKVHGGLEGRLGHMAGFWESSQLR